MTNKLYGTVLLKAAKILDVLADGESKTVQQISNITEISPPTVSKILTTLLYIHYVSKNDSRHEYYLGPKLIQYGQVQTSITELIETTRKSLDALRERIDETIHLSVLEDDKVVYVRKLEPKHQNIFMTSRVGISRELYSSGMGKAVLSTYDDEQLDHYLSTHQLSPVTSHTITDPAQLRRDLKLSQKRGYAVDDEEQERDCYCLATTLVANRGLIGAMSVSVPKFRITTDYEREIVASLMATKQNIESKLGTV